MIGGQHLGISNGEDCSDPPHLVIEGVDGALETDEERAECGIRPPELMSDQLVDSSAPPATHDDAMPSEAERGRGEKSE